MGRLLSASRPCYLRDACRATCCWIARHTDFYLQASFCRTARRRDVFAQVDIRPEGRSRVNEKTGPLSLFAYVFWSLVGRGGRQSTVVSPAAMLVAMRNAAAFHIGIFNEQKLHPEKLAGCKLFEA